MYEYKKRPSKFKKFFLMLLLISIVSALSIYIYNMYINTEIYSSDSSSSYEATRLSKTTNIENEENDITEILDKTIKCVVGISKIKNTGNSIFLNNSTKELGLGTGMIITSIRIYSYKLACCRK